MSPWFPRRRPGVRFLILFPGRTGSSWLVDALSRHPDVRVEGEILVGRSPSEQARDWARLLGARGGSQVSGFKTKLKDVAEPESLSSWLNANPVVVIHMGRADLLRLATSKINARRLHEASGHWNAGEAVRPIEKTPIPVDLMEDALASSRQDVEGLQRFVDGLENPIRTVDYAEILQDPVGVLDRVQAWLELPVRSLEPRVVKNTDQDLRAAIPNLADLQAHFAQGPWAPVFDVDLVTERMDGAGR